MKVDLHTHSTASDGVLSADELIQIATDKPLDYFSITDHDTITGYLSVREKAKAIGMNLIAGLELSTLWNGIGVHIVGPNFEPTHSAMAHLLQHQTDARIARTDTILQKLAKIGFELSLSELQSSVGKGVIGRPHIAQLMVEKGYVKGTNQAFKKYLGNGKIGDVKNGWISLSDGVKAIRESGGVAVIAHPNHYNVTRTKLLRLVDEFIGAGGQGIEVISGKQHRDVTDKIATIATDKGLYASIGSDFHRPLSFGVGVGELPPLPDSVPPIWELFH